MNKFNWVVWCIIVSMLAVPALASAQAAGSSSVDVQIQTLLSQITSLEQQLKSLVRSNAPTSTPPMWSASSTPPGMQVSTWNCSIFSRDLTIGSQGNDVMQLQQMLEGNGFFSASSTGFFGPLTAHALMQFQAHFGIATSTGFFGPLTRNFLQGRCGQGGMMGSSTPNMMWFGTSTPPMPHGPGSEWMGTSTGNQMYGPGPMGSSTAPRPCPENAPNSDEDAVLGLLQLHVILPGMMNPCGAPGPQGALQ